MLSIIPIVIKERSKIIHIIKNLNNNTNVNEYSLKKNEFDPLKSSPPNNFMIKLKKRVSLYHADTKLDIFDSE